MRFSVLLTPLFLRYMGFLSTTFSRCFFFSTSLFHKPSVPRSSTKHSLTALRKHELQIDVALAQLRACVFSFLQARARMLWDNIIPSATGPRPSPAPESAPGSSAQAPALSASVSGPTHMLGTLWRTYSPAIIAGGTALLRRQGVTPGNARASATGDEPTQRYDVSDGPEPIPMPHMQSRTSSSESAGGFRGQIASNTNIGPGGRFEEIEVPSDAEGERVNDSPTASPPRPSSGWFS